MSRVNVPVQQAGPYATGITQLTATAADSSNGHTIANNDGRTLFVVNNGSGSPVTATANGVAGASTFNTAVTKAVTVPAGKIGTLGPFAQGAFNQPDGSVSIDISAQTTITVSAVSVNTTP